MCSVSDKVTHNRFKESQNSMRESLKMCLYNWWTIIALQIRYVRVELDPIQILKCYPELIGPPLSNHPCHATDVQSCA